MNKVPFYKKEVQNNQEPFDWLYGKNDSNVILENRKLNVQILRYHITSPDGKVLYDTISIREPKTNSVTVIKNEQNQIGLIKEYRPVPAKWFWACVRGFGVPDDEDNLGTAKREMIEEIGNCTIINSKKIGILFQNTTFYEIPVGIVLLNVKESNNKIDLENGIVEFRFFSIKDIKKMISNGEVEDLFTISALARYLIAEDLL
jgi:hypothetical protein